MQSLTFNDPGKEAFENIVGKGENAGNQHFLLFPQYFLPCPKKKKKILILATSNLSFANALNFVQPKKLSADKESRTNTENF